MTCQLLLSAHLSKEMFFVSSCVATTGVDRRAATCSSLGCSAPTRLKAFVHGLVEGEAGEEERHGSVSQNTSCLSWSTSITMALESEWQVERETEWMEAN